MRSVERASLSGFLMAIGVFLSQSGDPRDEDSEWVCSLENDGAFWHLWPYFESLHATTGQIVEPYSIGVFTGHTLAPLRETLSAARQELLLKPPSWEVVTGKQIAPEERVARAVVSRDGLQSLLDILLKAVEDAGATGRCLTFFGD